jgi:hypothetical protein
LQQERFTNVYRELDPGTEYARLQILELDAPRADKIFNIMLYRLIGRAETHAAIGFQWLDTFDSGHLIRVLRHLRDFEHKAPFTAAYMVSAYSALGARDKIDSVGQIFHALQNGFDDLFARIAACDSAASVYGELRQIYGFGNFLAYQVLVDLLYPLNIHAGAPVLPYTNDDWASAGPGAQRGVGMLVQERSADLEVMRWLRSHQTDEFDRLQLSFPFLADADGRNVELSLANIQNCLCEFHKYVKINEGTGRGRRKFRVPTATPSGQLTLPFARLPVMHP